MFPNALAGYSSALLKLVESFFAQIFSLDGPAHGRHFRTT